MLSTRKLLAAFAVATGLLALGPSAQAGPMTNMTPLPALVPFTTQPSTEPVHWRPYYHCHSRCVRWRWGKCRRYVRYCHRR